jgi:hypothetical protein
MTASLVVVAAVGIVWTAAAASSFYVFERYPGHKDAGLWGAVVSSPLLFGVVLNLSNITIASGNQSALTLLVLGFTLVGYAAGMATVLRHEHPNQTVEETAVDTSSTDQ